MKRVALYDPAWQTMGGGEKYIASIGAWLARNPELQVTLLADHPGITAGRLLSVFNLDCSSCTCKTIPPGGASAELFHADIGIVVSNFRSFGTPAKKNILILQIPYGGISPLTIAGRLLRAEAREAAKDLSRLFLLRDARKADLVLVYSSFVSGVLRDRHRVETEVLHPSIDDFGPGGPKRTIILSVGRIFRGTYNDKRYDALIDGFKLLCERTGRRDWEYHIAGNAGNDRASAAYLASLRKRAEGYPVKFFVNEPYARLREHYAEASVFWHGAGYGVDERREPERTEHFGMTTVEAMSAGCIPVVVNKGGQKEIVRNGECGFVWESLDDLVFATARLMDDPTLASSLAAAARMRFLDFDQNHFESRLRELVARL